MSPTLDARRATIDALLAETADSRGVWYEDGPYGGTVVLRIDAAQLRRVLAARPAYLSTKPKLRLAVPGLRIVKPKARVA